VFLRGRFVVKKSRDTETRAPTYSSIPCLSGSGGHVSALACRIS
jgi:hypothetical protein